MIGEIAAIVTLIMVGCAIVVLVVWWVARLRRGARNGESWVALESALGIDDDDGGTASAPPREIDLTAVDEIVALVDSTGRIVARSDAARDLFDGEIGARYTDLGRMRPVARAGAFDQSEHPVALVLRGATPGATCCAVEAEAGLLVGELTVQPTRVGDDTMALLLFRPAVAAVEGVDGPVASGP